MTGSDKITIWFLLVVFGVLLFWFYPDLNGMTIFTKKCSLRIFSIYYWI